VAGRSPRRRVPPPRPDTEMRGDPGRRELQLRGVTTPMLYVFRPVRPNGVALLAAPGGGYEFLAASNEGLHVAETFRALAIPFLC